MQTWFLCNQCFFLWFAGRSEPEMQPRKFKKKQQWRIKGICTGFVVISERSSSSHWKQTRQYTRYRHFTTNNSCNSCSLSLPICVFMLFSLLFIYNAYIFPVPLMLIWKVKKKKRSLSIVFLLWLHCTTICSSPLHSFISLSLSCIGTKEQGRAMCERTEWSGERLEFIKNKWLLDDDLFNHKWALWAWSSEARGEEKKRKWARDKG